MKRPASVARDLVEVPVLIDRERILRMDSYAMELILQETGKNTMNGQFAPRNFDDFALFVWACAQTDADDLGVPLTRETVLDSLFIHQFKDVIEVTSKLLGTSEKDPDMLAPYVPSDVGLINAAITLSGLKTDENYWDLGAGDGRTLAIAARTGANVFGVEMDPNRANLAKGLIKRQGVPESNLIHGRIQDVDFSRADVVFIYLQTSAFDVLAPKLVETLKPGTRIVSHDFTILQWTAIKTQAYTVRGDDRTHMLYLYEIGKSNLEREEGILTTTEIDIIAEAIEGDIDDFFRSLESLGKGEMVQ